MSNLNPKFIPTTPEIEEFARILVQQVRDVAIHRCDALLTPRSRARISERWKRVAQNADPEVLLKEVIPDIVDATLFQLLDAVDEGWLKISYRAENGKVADLNAEGGHELGGWYLGGAKWVGVPCTRSSALSTIFPPSRQNLELQISRMVTLVG